MRRLIMVAITVLALLALPLFAQAETFVVNNGKNPTLVVHYGTDGGEVSAGVGVLDHPNCGKQSEVKANTDGAKVCASDPFGSINIGGN